MKILWFTNTPCGATEKLTGKSVTGGGWLYALSEQINKEPTIDLHIAFYWGESCPIFKYKGITYHPVLRNGDNNKIGRMFVRLKKAYSEEIHKKELPRLLKVVEEVQPDLIHIHGSEDNFGMIAKEKISCPIVLSIQGLLSPILEKFYSGFTKKDILTKEKLSDFLACNGVNVYEKSFTRRAAMERDFLKQIPYIIGRTFWDKSCTLALNPKRQYFVVDEILRPEFFTKKWNKTAYSDTYMLISTISHGWYKGVETVFKTAKILCEAGFDFQWKVIGVDHKNTAVKLSECICGRTARDLNINLLGRKNAGEMVDLMLQADTFVQVSHIENSPNSLCEAMLLGLPCIATFAGGSASMLENNKEGRLVQDGDPYAMAGIILEMSSDFYQATEFGKKASSRALERHCPERVCYQLIDAYNTIISCKE